MTVIPTLEIYNFPQKLQGMTNNVGLTFNVGDTTPKCPGHDACVE